MQNFKRGEIISALKPIFIIYVNKCVSMWSLLLMWGLGWGHYPIIVLAWPRLPVNLWQLCGCALEFPFFHVLHSPFFVGVDMKWTYMEITLLVVVLSGSNIMTFYVKRSFINCSYTIQACRGNNGALLSLWVGLVTFTIQTFPWASLLILMTLLETPLHPHISSMLLFDLVLRLKLESQRKTSGMMILFLQMAAYSSLWALNLSVCGHHVAWKCSSQSSDGHLLQPAYHWARCLAISTNSCL